MPFQGDVEHVTSGKNPGNLALLAMLAESDDLLHRHLYQPRARNATYLSPKSWAMTWCVAKFFEVRKARFYSILADEISSHNVEHLCLCLRFVNDTSHIRKEFITFFKLERVRAIVITNAIVNCLEGLEDVTE